MASKNCWSSSFNSPADCRTIRMYCSLVNVSVRLSPSTSKEHSIISPSSSTIVRISPFTDHVPVPDHVPVLSWSAKVPAASIRRIGDQTLSRRPVSRLPVKSWTRKAAVALSTRPCSRIAVTRFSLIVSTISVPTYPHDPTIPGDESEDEPVTRAVPSTGRSTATSYPPFTGMLDQEPSTAPSCTARAR